MTTKTCTKCGETKTTDQFYKSRKGKCGVRSQCKTCVRTQQRAYQEENRDKINAQRRAYHEANREECNARNRARHALVGEPHTGRAQSITEKHATRIRDPWTPEEDRYIITGPGTYMDKALQLSRTYSAVSQRAQRLRQEQTA